jgi:hypothetical protein
MAWSERQRLKTFQRLSLTRLDTRWRRPVSQNLPREEFFTQVRSLRSGVKLAPRYGVWAWVRTSIFTGTDIALFTFYELGMRLHSQVQNSIPKCTELDWETGTDPLQDRTAHFESKKIWQWLLNFSEEWEQYHSLSNSRHFISGHVSDALGRLYHSFPDLEESIVWNSFGRNLRTKFYKGLLQVWYIVFLALEWYLVNSSDTL